MNTPSAESETMYTPDIDFEISVSIELSERPYKFLICQINTNLYSLEPMHLGAFLSNLISKHAKFLGILQSDDMLNKTPLNNFNVDV